MRQDKRKRVEALEHRLGKDYPHLIIAWSDEELIALLRQYGDLTRVILWPGSSDDELSKPDKQD